MKTITLHYDDKDFNILEKHKDKTELSWEKFFVMLHNYIISQEKGK